MGRHHRTRPPRVRHRAVASIARPASRHRVPALFSAAVLASIAGPGVAFAADTADTAGTSTGTSSGSAGALDPAGSAVGTATGTDDDAGQDPVTTTVDGLRDDTDTDDAEPGRSDDSDDTGATTVTLAPKNGSGVSGTARITEDDVVATATGMDPGARYVSFFYGATSSSSNNNPCILDGTNPLPSEQTVGTWTVDADGTGTLRADNPLGSRYRLQAGTMSIRKVAHGFSKATALPVNPASYALVACGTVRRIAALDPVTGAVPPVPKLPPVRPVSS